MEEPSIPNSPGDLVLSDSKAKISFFQACTILMLSNGLTNHVIVNPMLLDAGGRDSWISVLVAGAFFVLWGLLLAAFMKRTGQSELRTWLASKTHPAAAWTLTLPLVALLCLIGGMTVIHTTTWTVNNYLPETPKAVLALIVVSLCASFAMWGLRVIAIMSGILLPFVILLGIFVAVANHPHKNLHLLKPFLEFGWSPVLQGMVYAGAGFVELVTLVAMQHRLKTQAKPWKIAIYAILMVYIMLGPLIGAISEFGPKEAAKQMISPYEQWRLVKLGNYVEHVDFFSIYQWLSGACIRNSLSIYLMLELLNIRPRRRNVWILLTGLGYVGVSLIPFNEFSFYLWQYRYYFPISLIVMLAVSLAWIAISFAVPPSKGGSS